MSFLVLIFTPWSPPYIVCYVHIISHVMTADDLHQDMEYRL